MLATMYGSITDSINEFVADNESLADIIAARQHGTLVAEVAAGA